MRHKLTVLWFLLCPALLHAQLESAKHAAVRIPSHGLSGVCIHTQPGASWIISAAHGWDDEASLRKEIKIDVLSPKGTALPKLLGKPKLLSVNHVSDLVLIYLPMGPLPYIAHVAPPGMKLVGRSVLSVGFDEMKETPTLAMDKIKGADRDWITTFGHPWYGRSGGALLDTESGFLVGVTHGFFVVRGPGGQRVPGDGIYCSHVNILALCAAYKVPVAARMPQASAAPVRPCPKMCPRGGCDGDCPDGCCPQREPLWATPEQYMPRGLPHNVTPPCGR